MTPEDVEGCWSLLSYVRVTDDSGPTTPYGDVKGVIVYQGGRMTCVFAARERVTASLDTCYAYSGVYEIVDNTVVHHVDVSVNPEREGTDQIRFVEFEDDVLHLAARVTEADIDVTYRLSWRRLQRSEALD